MSGAATPFSDYSLSQWGLASFPPGIADVEIKLTPNEDTETEGDEDAILTIQSDVSYEVDPYRGSATVWIKDNEVAIIKTDIDIDGKIDGMPFDETTEDTIGGLVLRRDANPDAPRKKIILQAVDPKGWTGDVRFWWTGVGFIRVFDAPTGGNEVPFVNWSITYPAASLPKTLYVEGSSWYYSTPIGSNTMRDVVLHLDPIVTGQEVARTDSAAFTVLWVIPTIRYGAQDLLSADNDKRDLIKARTIANHFNLGTQVVRRDNATGILVWSTVYETKGKVYPADFKYPSANLHFGRDIHSSLFIGAMGNTPSGTQHVFSNSIPLQAAPGPSGPISGNDTSNASIRDDNPAPNGYIYDNDTPGLTNAPKVQVTVHPIP